jgi:hypothetical protein
MRNIAALVIGVIVGGAINMGIIMLGSSLIPPPPGVDASDAESIAAGMHLFEAKHFITPFLAHALGTLVGALVAYVIAANNKLIMSLVVGIVSLLGGISAVFMIPSPMWFVALDLLLAYIPMAWLGGMIGQRLSGHREAV